jgi:hypothetical protein
MGSGETRQLDHEPTYQLVSSPHTYLERKSPGSSIMPPKKSKASTVGFQHALAVEVRLTVITQASDRPAAPPKAKGKRKVPGVSCEHN